MRSTARPRPLSLARVATAWVHFAWMRRQAQNQPAARKVLRDPMTQVQEPSPAPCYPAPPCTCCASLCDSHGTAAACECMVPPDGIGSSLADAEEKASEAFVGEGGGREKASKLGGIQQKAEQ